MPSPRKPSHLQPNPSQTVHTLFQHIVITRTKDNEKKYGCIFPRGIKLPHPCLVQTRTMASIFQLDCKLSWDYLFSALIHDCWTDAVWEPHCCGLAPQRKKKAD